MATERGFDKWVGLESCRKGKGGLEGSLHRDKLGQRLEGKGQVGVMGLVLFAQRGDRWKVKLQRWGKA